MGFWYGKLQYHSSFSAEVQGYTTDAVWHRSFTDLMQINFHLFMSPSLLRYLMSFIVSGTFNTH